MAARSTIHELTAQIEALRPKDRMELLRRVLTPELQLQLLTEDLSFRTKDHDPEVISHEVDEAVREVRARRQHRASA